MRKIFTTCIVTFCAVLLCAQMRVWVGGQKLFEVNLSLIDSITFVKPGQSGDDPIVNPDTVPTVNPDTVPAVNPDTASATGFTYDNWRSQTKISIYGYDAPVALPWASGTSTSMPNEYKHPEKDTLIDAVTPRWQLAFNLCDSSSLPGVDMFGLWDAHGQILRIYTYLEQLPNQSATSCYYQISSSVPAFVDPDTRGWMPADSTIKTGVWANSIAGNLPMPSMTDRFLVPVTGTLNGVCEQGWICYELDFSTGLFD